MIPRTYKKEVVTPAKREMIMFCKFCSNAETSCLGQTRQRYGPQQQMGESLYVTHSRW